MKKTALALALGLSCLHGGAFASNTATPIRHVIVIFQENVSFDHYFATYPKARNEAGDPPFHAAKNTPAVNGLTDFLLEHNPNAANPYRFERSEVMTCDMEHEYTAEQLAYDSGLMDKFVEYTAATSKQCEPRQVMGYYDGNTVTALWNYAQHFAMSDNFFGTTFGPSTPGALNLVSGQTHGATPSNQTESTRDGTVYGDPDPAYDDCSKGETIAMSGRNVGDLLNSRKLTWGWFEGGFRPSGYNGKVALCGVKSRNIAGELVTDYSAHHEPFQYYASTSNPHHLAPSGVDKIGHGDRANHQYDLKDFWAAAESGHLPAVSFLKAPKAQDGHAGYSDPLDEQDFIVATINRLQKLGDWKDAAVFITYDDSDGWYDHVMGPIVSQSDTNLDALTGSGSCGKTGRDGYSGRCGYGPRIPLLLVSPWAKRNYVSHSLADQSSILRFIEDNWHLGRIGNHSFDAQAGSLDKLFDFTRPNLKPLMLDPSSGLVVKAKRK